MQTYEVLLRPVVSEKSTELASMNKYTFAVSSRSNKVEIRRAVEDRYKVRVSSVRTVSMPAKEKGSGFIGTNKRRRGLNTPWKKAIVTLQVGERISDFFGAI
ncbi:MAG: 50S ribosomal protein L23 [Chloroflexota bacterium]|nr:MAG: 50S ribosomal protein L23 [Chloroflexota bacterium]